MRLSITLFSITILSKEYPKIIPLSIITLRIITLSIMTFNMIGNKKKHSA